MPGGLGSISASRPVPEPRLPDPRLHLDISGGSRQAEVVHRALDLGARHLDIGQRDVPWVVLADPEGNPFCVMEERPEYSTSGLIAALPLDSADPAATRRSGPSCPAGSRSPRPCPPALRHSSGRGVLLALRPEPRPKDAGTKNRLHLDLRLESDDDPEAGRGPRRRGRRRPPLTGASCPWWVVTDPSGNEVRLLRAAPPPTSAGNPFGASRSLPRP